MRSTIMAWFRVCRSSCKRFLAAVTLVVLLAVYYGYQLYEDSEILYFRHTGSSTPCVLPELNPFDRKMMEYVWQPDPLVCDAPPVVYVDSNATLRYNLTAIHLLNEKIDNVKCEIYYIKRILDDDIEFEKPFLWRPSKPINEDFFRVKCTGSSDTLFDNTLTRLQKTKKKLRTIEEAIGEDKYSVIMFGIDSLSRSSAIRQLPKTFSYLQSLGAYDMKGYMKVAPHTFVNVAPLLSGYFAEELPGLNATWNYLDYAPFIWRNFSAQGSATLSGEDLPNLSTFNLVSRGFHTYPTDHYMRPFWLANFKLMPYHNLRTHVSRILEHNNLKLTKTSALCLADKPNHVVVMNYIKQFMSAYKNYRKFSFSFLTELSHEFQNLLQLGDDDLMQFFKWLSDEGYLDSTILIVFSDHGLKFGNNQHLFVARMENRMPLLSIVLPESLRRKYPKVAKSLKTNQERLASPFDLHATLRDILHGNYKHPGSFNINGKLRGISMFKELPAGRSCADASINETYCACYKSRKLNTTNNPLADRIATAVVDHINKLLHGHAECETLKLHGISELRKIEQGLKYTHTYRKSKLWFLPKNKEAENREDVRHVIIIETLPGHARFYATCDVINGQVNVFENVDRINKYGDQPHCVREHRLRPYCYCTEQLQ